MPKKKTLFEEAADGLTVAVVANSEVGVIEGLKNDPAPFKKITISLVECGHINKHFVNIDGVLENLYCVLLKGHEGDHEADYDCLRPVDGSIAQARLISAGKEVLTVAGKDYLELTERAYWSDGADTLAADIKPDLAQLAYIKANKGEMLDAEQLVRKA